MLMFCEISPLLTYQTHSYLSTYSLLCQAVSFPFGSHHGASFLVTITSFHFFLFWSPRQHLKECCSFVCLLPLPHWNMTSLRAGGFFRHIFTSAVYGVAQSRTRLKRLSSSSSSSSKPNLKKQAGKPRAQMYTD